MELYVYTELETNYEHAGCGTGGSNSYMPIFSMPLPKFDLHMIKEMLWIVEENH
jgi:vacuolar-type H+-ATPase subunit B/Vma2